MRVFVSSTVFDLIDIRAEIASQLSSLGIVPVMSDDKLSDFQVQPHEDSIATCLINLASCDEVILVLDRRYGPRLGKAGFEDVSATHLEYRHAIKLKKPTHVFVRDRTEADHGIWKKNKNQESFKLNWVRNDDFGIFELLDEHKSLEANSSKSNWVDTFSSSIDLKAAIEKRFEERVLPQRLLDALQRNEFPIIDIKVATELVPHDLKLLLKADIRFNNLSNAPAFRFCVVQDDADPGKTEILAAGGSHLRVCIEDIGTAINSDFEVSYESTIGIAVRERYHVDIHTIGRRSTGLGVVSKVDRVSQTFIRSEGIQIKIDGG